MVVMGVLLGLTETIGELPESGAAFGAEAASLLLLIVGARGPGR